METPPPSSPLIPTTVPQARRVRTPPRQEPSRAPVRVHNGPARTPHLPIRLPPQTRARLDAHAHIRTLADLELRLLPYPHTVPSQKRSGLTMAIADKVMKRIPVGGALPTDLRLFCVQAAHEIIESGPVAGIAFNVAAWATTTPPPLRAVTPSADPSLWYPHDPLGLGGTEFDLERAAVTFSARLLMREQPPR